jgi:DNA modification methylase
MPSSVTRSSPYGLEFMGKDWDRPWAVSPTSSVGYEGREDNLTLPSHRDGRNANCRRCGGRARGAKRCQCASPQWDRAPAQDMRDFQAWCEAWAREALRVLKPGGHLLAFGGTRTYHRLAAGIEDAGFEIRDTIAWMYGSGFPKSLEVSKAIDKAAGAEREVVGQHVQSAQTRGDQNTLEGGSLAWQHDLTVPATREAQAWEGWGTALKPAHEPIVVARKPLSGTVASNCLAYGTGALNIDACRIDYQTVPGGSLAQNTHLRSSVKRSHPKGMYQPGSEAPCMYCGEPVEDHNEDGSCPVQVVGEELRRRGAPDYVPPSGRWPANVVLGHSEGCVPTGTRRVKGHAGYPNGPGGSSSQLSQKGTPTTRTGPWAGHADADGLETVTAWECEPGCPVRQLDEQTAGARAAQPSGTHERHNASDGRGVSMGTGWGGHVSVGVDDASGASRFFAQFNHTEEPCHCLSAPANTAAPCSCHHADLHGSADDRAPDVQRHAPEDSSRPSSAPVQPAAPTSSTTPAQPPGATARRDAGPTPSASSAPTANAAADPSDSCATDSAHTLAPPSRSPAHDLHQRPGQPSTQPPSEPTPYHFRARTAEHQDSTDTTSSTTTPPASSGSASPAIPIDTLDASGRGPTRFRYEPKSSSAERNAGLDGFDRAVTRVVNNQNAQRCEGCGRTLPNSVRECCGALVVVEVANPPRANVHPTVKPIELMRWLIRLVTPPGGTVLDPFLGSGSTGAAAVLERVEFIGIERDPEYLPIADARIKWWSEHPDGMQLVKRLEHEAERKAVVESGQTSMFDLLGDA